MTWLNLQGVLEVAEVLHLGSKQQVAELGEGQEDDEEHHSKPGQVLGALPQGRGQLGHRLVETDVLEDLENLIIIQNTCSVTFAWCNVLTLLQSKIKFPVVKVTTICQKN